jgi:uncharacterized protein
MVLIDVNLLVHVINVDFPDHARAKNWWLHLIQSPESIGLPWSVLVGFVRITTNFRAMSRPFTLEQALRQVSEWLALPRVRILHPGPDHARHFADQCQATNANGNLVTDAHLAALAVEHDCEIASNDSDFAKFPGVRWVNPLVP